MDSKPASIVDTTHSTKQTSPTNPTGVEIRTELTDAELSNASGGHGSVLAQHCASGQHIRTVIITC
jgi:hypothetical protein